MCKKGLIKALRFLTLGWVLLFAVCWQPVAAAGDGTFSASIEDYIRREMAAKKIPGLALGIVQGQEILFLQGFGTASIARGMTVSPQTVFDLASCSKSFTALAVLLLWHDGRIDLDRSFQHYVPEFKLDDTGIAADITVRQLLNQTSGLPGTFSEPVAYHQGPDAMEKLIAAMQNVGIRHTPGSVFEYTNLNYALLGALVERVSGQPFEDYVNNNIFLPLGMENTTLRPEIAAKSERADGHQLFLGKVITRNIPVYRSMTPAGWVMSSAADMCIWLEMSLNLGKVDGRQIIPAPVVALMQQTAVNITKEGEAAGYGMGWFTDVLADGAPVLWHGGDTPNFLAEMIMLPEQGLGIIMLVNGQTCTTAHSIAQNALAMVAGRNISLPAAPWWSSWKSTDDIAIYTIILCLVSLAFLGFYIWWQVRKIKNPDKPSAKAPRKNRRFWIFVLPATPWFLLALPFAAAFVIMQALFGVNVFITLFRVGYFTPPGITIAAVLMVLNLVLWAISISLLLIFKNILKPPERSRTSPGGIR